MTIQGVKNYLKEFRKLGKDIDRKLEEHDRLYSWSVKITPTYSDMPRATTNGDKIASVIERLEEINTSINADIDRYIEMRKGISASIETLEDITLHSVMGLYYLNGLTWEQVAERMGYELRSITRFHGTALEKLRLSCDVPMGA